MKSVFGFITFVLVLPTIADSQPSGLATGARVRVTSPSDDLKKHIGTLLEMRGDSLVVSDQRGSRSIALANVTSLDVSTGTRTRVVQSGSIGLGAGALLGAIVGAASYEGPDIVFDNAGEFAAVSGVVFGAAGLVVGGVIGALQRVDRWERRNVPIKAAIGASRSGGVSLSLSRAF